MFITTDELDITKYEADRVRPASIVPRQDGEVWFVRHTPLETDLSPRFLHTGEGSFVQIPLFPYRSLGVEPPRAIALAAKVGAMLVDEVMRELAWAVVIDRLHISIGHPVQDMGSALRFWIGFGMIIKEPGR